MHFPVMLSETQEYLDLAPGKLVYDATCGLGGHTAAIARKLSSLRPPGLVIACDRDAESLEQARENTKDCVSFIHFHQALFSQVGEVLAAENVSQLDGLLADVGVSRYQLTAAERGFSLAADGELDMRMSRGGGQTAADILNFESEQKLADLIYSLGEERRSRRIARAIVRARPLRTTGQLARVIESAAPRTGKLHPATQTFMALRIAVNRELEELDALLEAIPTVVKPGGRVVVITFHSLEDRKVKQSFLALAKAGRARLLTRHVVRPSEEEERSNPPSRSAKLRAIEVQESGIKG